MLCTRRPNPSPIMASVGIPPNCIIAPHIISARIAKKKNSTVGYSVVSQLLLKYAFAVKYVIMIIIAERILEAGTSNDRRERSTA